MATSAELLALFHLNPVDMTEPYRWDDSQVFAWLNEGQREACIRGPMIFDASTVAVCRVSVTAGTATYAVSSLITRLELVFLVDSAGTRTKLTSDDRDALDVEFPEWRTEADTPTGYVLEGNALTLNRVPTANATLYLEVYRAPLASMGASVQPEIPLVHHDELVNWALYRAHLVEDDDEEQPTGRWKKYLDRFEAYFGKKLSADLQRRQSAHGPLLSTVWYGP